MTNFNTQFKKGHIPWSKGKKLLQFSEKKSPHWKGNSIGSDGVHRWLRKKYGKANHCEICGLNDPKRMYHWSNIDHTWHRVFKDYMPMCVSCHRKYDFIILDVNY